LLFHSFKFFLIYFTDIREEQIFIAIELNFKFCVMVTFSSNQKPNVHYILNSNLLTLFIYLSHLYGDWFVKCYLKVSFKKWIQVHNPRLVVQLFGCRIKKLLRGN